MDDTLHSLAAHIESLFCDSDGVLFPNTILMGAPFKAKYRSYYDGLGLLFLARNWYSHRLHHERKGKSAAALRETVEKLNSLPSSKPQKADG